MLCPAPIRRQICSAVRIEYRERGRSRDLPSTATIYHWLMRYPDFAQMYAAACEQRADLLAEEVMHIADAPGDATSEAGVPSRELLNWAKVRIAERKWMASKLAPLKYALRPAAPDPAGPISHEDALLELE